MYDKKIMRCESKYLFGIQQLRQLLSRQTLPHTRTAEEMKRIDDANGKYPVS